MIGLVGADSWNADERDAVGQGSHDAPVPAVRDHQSRLGQNRLVGYHAEDDCIFLAG